MGGFTMNIKIRRQKTEDRKQTSCLHRLKPATTHCSLLFAFCFLLLLLVGKVFADTQSISDISYNVIRITDGSSMDYNPEFSPDGKQIVFISKIDTDGSNLNRIAEIEGDTEHWRTVQYPVPTPDGKGLILILYKKESVSGVWFMDIESGKTRRITSGGNGDYFPVMSPDGKEIVFESMRLGSVGSSGDIWSVDISGKNYKRLTYENYPELYPEWSPDGTKISYVAKKEGIIDIWIMDRDGKHRKRVTKDILKEVWGRRWLSMFNYNDLFDAGYYHVSWHPDGTKLALTTWEPDKKESYLTILDFKEDISKE